MHIPFSQPGGRRYPLRALVFDMDGTIVDTRAYHMAAWRQLVARLGLAERHYLMAEQGFGKTNWAIFRQWFGPNANGYDYDALSEEKETIFRRLIQGRERPRPGLFELLALARRLGLKVALATSGPASNAEFLLRELGIGQYFEAVVCGSARIRSKPHPESFLRTAARLGVAPQQCAGLEDSPHGLLAVRRAGMRLVAIAERPADLSRLRRWTAFAYPDFRPVVRLLSLWTK